MAQFIGPAIGALIPAAVGGITAYLANRKPKTAGDILAGRGMACGNPSYGNGIMNNRRLMAHIRRMRRQGKGFKEIMGSIGHFFKHRVYPAGKKIVGAAWNEYNTNPVFREAVHTGAKNLASYAYKKYKGGKIKHRKAKAIKYKRTKTSHKKRRGGRRGGEVANIIPGPLP